MPLGTTLSAVSFPRISAAILVAHFSTSPSSLFFRMLRRLSFASLADLVLTRP